MLLGGINVTVRYRAFSVDKKVQACAEVMVDLLI